MIKGNLERIYLARVKTERPTPVDSVVAVAGKGLVGDRYYDERGHAKVDKELTLIEAEAVEAVARDYDAKIDPGEARRNLIVRGVALNHLVGVEFRIGEVVLRGVKLCEPCSHLADMTSSKVTKGLIHRGGLRAQILRGGTLRVGDEVSSAVA